MKICKNCGCEHTRPISNFCSKICDKKHRRKECKKIGLCVSCGRKKEEGSNLTVCNSCSKRNIEYSNKNREKISLNERNKRLSSKENGMCTLCHKKPNGKTLLCDNCLSKSYEVASRYVLKPEYPKLLLLGNAKSRSKKQNLPCNITLDDIEIPKVCPILGIELISGKGKLLPSSPTLDKIIPELGYVRGNIRVISSKANLMKSNLTKEILLKILDYIDGKI
jgi:hypothetical protein